MLFLLAWEVMSVLSYLLIVHNRGQENGHASAGYLLLAMGEAGTLAAALSFLVLAINVNSVDFATLKSAASGLSGGARWAVFLFSFFGFGVKAGLVPVNGWLPRAYTLAPRAFVPVLAGATLNLGLYGILRVNADLMPATQAGPGLVALVVGTISALLGILYATTDNDLKTMLAHSSIENVGIVVAGFGSGMVFVATHHPALAAIAFVAGLYHLINHSLYKTLLFFGVGAVETQTGTCDMDRLGRLNQMDAVDCSWLSRRHALHCRAATVQRLRQRMAHFANDAPLGGTLFDVDENRFCPVRRGTRPYGGAGGHLFCESVCDELFGNAPFGRKSSQ